MVYAYSDSKVDQILIFYKNQSEESTSKSVEIFILSLTVFELQAF